MKTPCGSFAGLLRQRGYSGSAAEAERLNISWRSDMWRGINMAARSLVARKVLLKACCGWKGMKRLSDGQAARYLEYRWPLPFLATARQLFSVMAL
jgi:hypothetical protein